MWAPFVSTLIVLVLLLLVGLTWVLSQFSTVKISVAGSTFMGQLLTFGILIVAIETRVVERPLQRWMLVGLGAVLSVTFISTGSLLFVFNSINYDEPIVGPMAWFMVAVCIALYLTVLGSVLSSVIVRYTEADRSAREKATGPDK